MRGGHLWHGSMADPQKGMRIGSTEGDEDASLAGIQDFLLNLHKRLASGRCPEPAGGAYSTRPDDLAGFKQAAPWQGRTKGEERRDQPLPLPPVPVSATVGDSMRGKNCK